jgi:uroporphyrin-III C-methyltransferase
MILEQGTVYLVGAGPGDPGLLTLKAYDCLRQGDVILHDRLVSPAILGLASPDAHFVPVGKEGGGICFPQDGIHQLLISYAREGKKVVRLKGGDPFLFGRGGEEALALEEEGIPFEIIPGVTSALAVPAAVGIPVTHRNLASQVVFVTAHGQNGTNPIDWARLATLEGTLVVLMPLGTLEKITEQLILGGMPPHTPSAMIHAGTTPTQKVVIASLATIADKTSQAGFGSPALLVIGEVVTLSSRIGEGMRLSDNGEFPSEGNVVKPNFNPQPAHPSPFHQD